MLGFLAQPIKASNFGINIFVRHANAMQSSETEPSPAFVTFAHAHEQLFPLPKWRGERLEVLET